MLWVLKRTVSILTYYVKIDGQENIYNFRLKCFVYLNLCIVILNRLQHGSGCFGEYTQFSCHLIIQLCLFDLILYIPSTIFQLNRDGSSWVEPVLS